jgi:hypothetical protein
VRESRKSAPLWAHFRQLDILLRKGFQAFTVERRVAQMRKMGSVRFQFEKSDDPSVG